MPRLEDRRPSWTLIACDEMPNPNVYWGVCLRMAVAPLVINWGTRNERVSPNLDQGHRDPLQVVECLRPHSHCPDQVCWCRRSPANLMPPITVTPASFLANMADSWVTGSSQKSGCELVPRKEGIHRQAALSPLLWTPASRGTLTRPSEPIDFLYRK